MNTKKEIVSFLEELAIGVQEKRDNYKSEIKKYQKRINELSYLVTSSYSDDALEMRREYEFMLEHTKGQLYEINYILGTITRDKRKRDY